MQAKVGSRLRSAVCATEVIVVRSSGDDLDIRCGGHPLLAPGESSDPDGVPSVGFDSGSVLGKRYSDEAGGVEVLVTKPGAGSLSIGNAVLALKEAKALPSSD